MVHHHHAHHLLYIQGYQMDRSHLYRLDHAQHHLALTTLLLTKNDRLTSADPHHSVEEEEESSPSNQPQAILSH